MAAKTLRDWAKEYGLDVGWKDGQVTVGGTAFQQGTSGMGLAFDPTGTHYVHDEAALMQALGMTPQTQTPQTQMQAPVAQMPTYQPQSYNTTQTIEDLYQQQRSAQLLSLQNQLRGQTDALSRQKLLLAPGYQQERVQADTTAQLAGRRLAEYMASQGLGRSGENVQANIGIQTALQQAKSDIAGREGMAEQQIDQRIADLGVASSGDIAAMEKALSADKTQAMLSDMYRSQEFDYQRYKDQLENYWRGEQLDYQRGRDEVADTRYDQEFAWQTDPTNPDYQRKMLQLEIDRLNLANMPEQIKLEMQALKQKISNGSIGIATAQEQLKQLREKADVEAEEKPPTAAEWEVKAYAYVDKLLRESGYDEAFKYVTSYADILREQIGVTKYNALVKYVQESRPAY